jgi:GntR family transcriptional regulator
VTVLIHVDYSSGEPICHQVVARVKLLVVNGKLKRGDKLPSIRQLARDLHINPTTVTRIYNQLAAEGVVTLRHGHGVFISDGSLRLAPEELRRILGKHARTLLVEGLRHGVPVEQIQAVLAEEYKGIEKGEP